MATTKKKTTKKATPKRGAKKGTRKKASPKKPAAAKQPAKPGKKTSPKPAGEKKMSQVEAALKVLKEAGQPMTTKQMVAAMEEKGYWSSPGGKTPHATLYSAILREINQKGAESRFKKVDRGQFAAAS